MTLNAGFRSALKSIRIRKTGTTFVELLLESNDLYVAEAVMDPDTGIQIPDILF